MMISAACTVPARATAATISAFMAIPSFPCFALDAAANAGFRRWRRKDVGRRLRPDRIKGQTPYCKAEHPKRNKVSDPLFGAELGEGTAALDVEAHEGSEAVEGVDELAVGKRHEEREDETEMDGEQHAHRARLAKIEEQQSGDAGREQQYEKRDVHAVLVAIAEIRIAVRAQDQQSDRADDEARTADDSEQHGQAVERIRRLPAEDVVIDRAREGRREAEQESVEREVMEVAPRQGWNLARIGASVAAAFQVAQAHGVPRRVRKLRHAHEVRELPAPIRPEAQEAREERHE